MGRKDLVIVESPTKVKTIKKYLGDGYEVASSKGHIRDLPQKDIGIDIKNNFEPKYIITPDHVTVVNELKKRTKEANVIYLASDDDREGEAISWHIKETLNLDNNKTKRIVFHEITEKAIKNAINNPRDIDINLVNSQQARRILDRIVGYELSPVLWKKIQSGLSAGRVQSVAVKMIVEREREINSFTPTKSFKIIAQFVTIDNKNISAELKKTINDKDIVEDLFNKIKNDDFKIVKIEKKLAKRKPSPPFTTSTLQQEASQLLGYSVTRTMLLAQKLYEAGKISYMRTDSVILSEDAIEQARNVIVNDFGEEYLNERQYTNKSKLSQGAHEAIRPTNFANVEVSEDSGEQKLYSLIRRRALASQMADAQIDKTTITINDSTDIDTIFIAKGSLIRFDGFLKLYQSAFADDSDDDAILPKVSEGDILILKNATGKEKLSRGPSHYSEASLVKELEEKGIGRPSTYAPIINVIQKRGYVLLSSKEGKVRDCNVITLNNGQVSTTIEQEAHGSEKNKLFPTDIAIVVNDFLEKFFTDIVDYNFTADVEKQLDDTANGEKTWTSMLHEFYDKFSIKIDKCRDEEHVKMVPKLLGIDPTTGKNIYIRVTKYGSVIQIGNKTETESPRYINLLKTQKIEDITLEEAIKMSTLPRKIGEYNGKEIIANIGIYGPYVNHDGVFAPIKNGCDLFSISLEEAIKLIENRKEYIKNKKK